MIGKPTSQLAKLAMSLIQPLCSSTPSTEMPITLVPRFFHSSPSLATAPNSVVHTGVKSLGWENRIAQLSPIHSWKRIGPWLVSASKSGTTSLMRRDMVVLPVAW